MKDEAATVLHFHTSAVIEQVQGMQTGVEKQYHEKMLQSPPDRSADVEDKVCARCHTAKPSEEFSRDNRTVDGLYSYCRQVCFEEQLLTITYCHVMSTESTRIVNM